MAHAHSIAAAPLVEQLRASLAASRAGRSPKALHRVRVATRRLAVWLRLGGRGGRSLDADLRWLRAAADQVRDLDVLLAGVAMGRAGFRRWLGDERASARARWRETVERPRLAKLLESLARLAPLSRHAAKAALPRLARRAVRRGDRAERAPHDLERLHALRRALRRLRFGLEWLDQDTAALRALQDVLGELGDARVALAQLARWREHGGEQPAGLRARLERQVDDGQRAALAAWRGARAAVAKLAAK